MSVNPDLASDSGHYLYLDRALAREATERGWEFASWGNTALPERLLQADPWLQPVFADQSFLSTHCTTEQRERFAQALLERSRDLLRTHPDGKVILFIYTGHPGQLVGFWRLLQSLDEPRLRVVFNLYAAHWEFEEERLRYRQLVDTLRRTLVPGAALVDRERFVLTSDSSLIATLAEKWWWAAVPVLPFFSIANVPPALPAQKKLTHVTVAYPSSVHRHRGFFAFPEMVQHCKDSVGEKVRFVFRTCMDEAVLSEDEKSLCRNLQRLGCDVLHGSLSDDAMCRFFADADVILSPYPVIHFKDRTSANVADALAFGKPVVAARDTWAGRLVEQLGCGETFLDGDALSMAQAVLQVVEKLSDYTESARTQGAAWQQENNLAALFSFLARIVSIPPASITRDTPPEDWKQSIFSLLDSALAESPAIAAQSTSKSSPRNNHLRQRIALLQEQNLGMRRAIEHHRASPVRALRLWLRRKLRQLTLEE